jgi:hypothetical protein
VAGTDTVWAAGDATVFPIKQGGVAAQMADAAAESIAARAGADVDPQPFHPMLRGVLLTGCGQRWMRGPDDIGEGATARRALFWPPTKITGRYLAPYLLAREEAEMLGPQARATRSRRPDGPRTGGAGCRRRSPGSAPAHGRLTARALDGTGA